MQLWLKLMKVANKFAGFADVNVRERAERISHDIQLEYGAMHSGYPIASQIEYVPNIIDEARIRKKGDWGPFHELGHNFQGQFWNINGKTSEATCNWWAIVMSESLKVKYDLRQRWALAETPLSTLN